jgi:hypothetical protein
MSKDQNPKGGGKRLPGRNEERGAKKGLNSQPNQTTTQGIRKMRWRSHKEHGLEKSSTYRRPEGLPTGEASSPPEGEHRCSGEGHGAARFWTIIILLAFVVAKGFKLFQMDVKSAFLNGDMEEEVYVPSEQAVDA